MIKRILSVACLPLLLLEGCAINQSVRPVEAMNDTQVCVIANPQVRPTFEAAYRNALSVKGYTVKQLPASAAITDCRVTSTYRATWRWDLAMYMAVAEIRVFVDGKEKGVALYDSSRGGGNPAKFIDAEKKIAELTNQLFVGGAGLRAVSVPAPIPATVQ
jgi:hypothetical protein